MLCLILSLGFFSACLSGGSGSSGNLSGGDTIGGDANSRGGDRGDGSMGVPGFVAKGFISHPKNLGKEYRKASDGTESLRLWTSAGTISEGEKYPIDAVKITEGELARIIAKQKEGAKSVEILNGVQIATFYANPDGSFDETFTVKDVAPRDWIVLAVNSVVDSKILIWFEGNTAEQTKAATAQIREVNLFVALGVGEWGPPEAGPVAGDSYLPSVSINSKGNAVGAWYEKQDGVDLCRVKASLYIFGLGWQDPTTLSETNCLVLGLDGGVNASINEAGKAVLSWEEIHSINGSNTVTDGVSQVYASYYSPEQGWETVRIGDEGTQSPQSGIDAAGNAYVAYGTGFFGITVERNSGSGWEESFHKEMDYRHHSFSVRSNGDTLLVLSVLNKDLNLPGGEKDASLVAYPFLSGNWQEPITTPLTGVDFNSVYGFGLDWKASLAVVKWKTFLESETRIMARMLSVTEGWMEETVLQEAVSVHSEVGVSDNGTAFALLQNAGYLSVRVFSPGFGWAIEDKELFGGQGGFHGFINLNLSVDARGNALISSSKWENLSLNFYSHRYLHEKGWEENEKKIHEVSEFEGGVPESGFHMSDGKYGIAIWNQPSSDPGIQRIFSSLYTIE